MLKLHFLNLNIYNQPRPITIKFFFILAITSIIAIFYCTPPLSLSPPNLHFTQVFTAEDGSPLRAFPDNNGIWRYPITLNETSPLYIKALINYEDRWFWHHPGVNPLSIVRAFFQNIFHSKIISGGSTLTMQVARLLSPHSRSIFGKIKQILIALHLECHYSKKQILNYYLNHAPFGGTIEGIQAASYTYLGKSAKELSHAEAALLTVLPQAPSRNRPDKYPNRALLVRNKVLSRLASQSIWTKQIIKQALLEPITSQHTTQPRIAPLLARRLKSHKTTKPIIKTTLDFDMQIGIEALVKNYVNHLPDKTSIAVLVVENKSLKVKAYIGSADFLDLTRFGHIDMIMATRSPGSTLKPFLYGIAIDQGIIHSESLLTDAPISFNGYSPQNFSQGFIGPVSVSQALQRSLNIPAVQLLQRVTPSFFVSKLKNAGLKLVLPNHVKSNLSIILGGIGSNLETLVGTYTALANGGLAGKIRFLDSSPIEHRYLISPDSAWVLKQILAHNNTNGPEQLSWKTGTSYGHRDFWSIGVTTKYTIGVWIGRPDGSSLPGHYGAHTATPLLFSITKDLIKSKRIKQPLTVTKKTICWPLGGLENETPSNLCHEKKLAWIVANNIPLTLMTGTKNHWQPNPLSVQINPDIQQTTTKTSSCNNVDIVEKQIALWPLSVEPWIAKKYRRNSQTGFINLNCNSSVFFSSNELKIKDIKNNSKLRSAGASTQLPKIKLHADGSQGKLYWFINAKLIYTATHDQPILHQFNSTGRYQITLVDEAGHSDSVSVIVLPHYHEPSLSRQ